MKERDIRILLVDDHDLVLQGLKRIVECSLPEIKNVCTASSGQEALHLIASQRFNLFVLDMELPDISGMDIIVRIREKDPWARIIVNTMHEEIWFIKDLIQSAVDGILFKSIDSTKIAEAIRRVLDGGTYYCPYAEHIRLSKSCYKNYR
jgi:DNA-binding NarL/FixJ family response regulator